MAKKQSTADILARLRAEAKGQGGGDAPAAPAEPAAAPPPVDQPAAESAPAEEAPPAAAKPAAAKPAAGGKPKSTKDILAALRAEGAGGAKAAAPAAAKPASTRPAGKQPAKPAAVSPAAPAGGPRPSVQEMLRAAREGRPLEEPAAAQPAPRPQPKVPAAARKARQAEAAEPQSTRRNFLSRITTPFVLAWVAFGAASAAFGLGLARFMMPNVLVAAPSRFKIGPPSDYPPDMVSEKWKAQFGIWVVNTVYNGQRQIYALVSVCTHLGCTPNWLQGEQKFKCPCHGSGFYISGINFEGPAPRPLERAGISLAPDGMLEVDKSLKFQEEMGQWADATSYVPVV